MLNLVAAAAQKKKKVIAIHECLGTYMTDLSDKSILTLQEELGTAVVSWELWFERLQIVH